ncbi:DUF3048 domain-containing protein [Actinacidiphila yeochonensis]|uniref:DUF3048 domain-containing protein n=1 Tax=Actinacidiphila yeochonensis TaxID=89050 RepID=UPI00055C541C|nr:DUF3048 domain-containing protein [Actinacidiphila yeochonensis]
MRARRVRGAGAAAVLALALAAGCTATTGTTGQDGGGRRTTAPARNVLTGEPGQAGRVLAVKVDNVAAARPQTGLNDADLVYAIEVEGGLSRLMAVFDDRHLPSVVGPVRSARETDLQLLAEYDHPALAFSGAQSKLLPVLQGSRAIVARTGTRAFFRSSDRPAPHNEYLRPAGLTAGAGPAKDIGLRFSSAVPAGGTARASASAAMPAARFAFTWTGTHYRVAMDGTGSPWTADNVIVQHVQVKQSQYHSRTGFVPFSQTVGNGSATLLRNGRSYPLRWSRPSPADGTTYTADGHPAQLHPGRTWIVLTPS